MADALEIKKNEIEAMENELKKLSAINRENHHSNKVSSLFQKAFLILKFTYFYLLIFFWCCVMLNKNTVY